METLTHQHLVMASKEHTCNFCGCKINAGEGYMKSTHKYDGQVYDWKTHSYCADIATRLNMYDDADEGVSMDAFCETVSYKYHDIMVAKLSPNEEPDYADVIGQLQYVDFRQKLFYLIRYFKKAEIKEGAK